MYPRFRSGNSLATSFTGTLTERHGARVERMPDPERLRDWFVAQSLEVGACSAANLSAARELREAIHAIATAAALNEPLPAREVSIVNNRSGRGRAAAEILAAGERHWRLRQRAEVEDALGIVAEEAIALVAGERGGTLALCASPTCRAAFLDTTRGQTRRWCDMNSCGNREKKARLRGGRKRRSSPV